MTRRRVQSIEIEGYTSIRSAAIELKDLNVLVGANGAGKSNLVSALGLLGRIAAGELGLAVGLAGGARTLLHQGVAPAPQITLRLDFPPHGYRATLVPSDQDELIFQGEPVSSRARAQSSGLVSANGLRESRLLTSLEPGATETPESAAAVPTSVPTAKVRTSPLSPTVSMPTATANVTRPESAWTTAK